MIGAAAGTSDLRGYYARSHVPASIVADFIEAVVVRRVRAGVRRVLLIDLCSGMESARAGMHAYRRRAAWAKHRDEGCEISYVSVDNNAACAPALCLDLTATEMHEVVQRACDAVGWSPSSVAALVWFSPPCETYSTLALGTLATAYWGGPQRRGKDASYTPVRGKRGAKARDADRLVFKVLGWLHRNTTRR